MAAALIRDDLVRSVSERTSVGSGSQRNWVTSSLREAWGTPDVFSRSMRDRIDEEELKWAAIERLPTSDRLRKGILKQVLDNGNVIHEEVDVSHLGVQDKKLLIESILKVVEDDNEKFLQRLRDRIDRVGIEIPKIEVRFEHLSIEGDAYVGSRALPTLLNSTLNQIEGVLGLIKLLPSKKRVVKILQDVSGIVKPSRMTLLLGPPGSGKTTLLQALAGKTEKDLRATGNITYCGHEMSEFIPQRTSAYISQHDLHHSEMTVRETLDFAGRCLGVGTRYELLVELSRREKDARIKPDPEIDAFMKATAMAGQESSLVTDYALKILGLDICADIMVGDEMRRGISGGQKKRLTTGEMLVGPAKVFIMDGISTGLDSSTTFQIIKTEMKSGQLADGGKFYGAVFFSLINVMFNGMAELHMTCGGFPCSLNKGIPFFTQRGLLPYRFGSFRSLSRLWNREYGSFSHTTLIGFAPSASRFFRQLLALFGIHQMALSLFRSIAGLGRTQVVAGTLGTFTLLMVFVFGGFIVAKDDIEPWMIWGYYISPMMYGQNAIAMNEFLDKRWSTPNTDPRFPEPTVGKVLLKARGMFVEDYMYWVCVIALFGFSVLFNICFIAALTFLNPLGEIQNLLLWMRIRKVRKRSTQFLIERNPLIRPQFLKVKSIDMSMRNTPHNPNINVKEIPTFRRGMVLPFQPLSLAFDHVNYYVDMPATITRSDLRTGSWSVTTPGGIPSKLELSRHLEQRTHTRLGEYPVASPSPLGLVLPGLSVIPRGENALVPGGYMPLYTQ
ncbi:pleiotropic drug resistance 6 [Actinidia rufa]|uniref:Pleiotropic drug resistance 6 n=1 Tax=Actinidia rufa TaxID=165716 RepID=A0A7J0G5F3_9ERIC|nr:pleiotropic drug resistance 6 [Actinidia rufa]